MHPGPVIYVVSVTMLVMAATMMVPAIVDWRSGIPEWRTYLYASAITLAPAFLLFAASRRPAVTIAPRQAFLITTVVWLAAAGAGAVPLALHEDLSITDAFFESMSGITTTGSTVIVGLDQLAPGILLWRSMLQWIGGLGFILMAVAILPLVGVGGMRLFRTESSDWTDKTLPRTRDIATKLALLYLGLTAICALCYRLSGMSWFDGINHAMTTIATGGYSTSDQSMGKYASTAILWTGTTFMLLGSLPFVLYLRALRRGPGALLRDDQVSFYLRMVVLLIAAGTVVLTLQSDRSAIDALTVVAFNAVSIITTTGYASTDYTLWGEFFVASFLFMMFVGGCSGSTSGSIKAFRLQIALILLNVQLKKLVHPNGVFVPKLYGRRLEPDITNALVAFIFAVGITVIGVSVALTAMGIDFITAMSAAATAVTNVGPGLGPIVGPAGNFAPLPDGAKWLLSAAMLLGRLELLTVVVLFSRAYWRG